MVSIIVPIYNAENTLSKCVDSILRQTYSDLEVLLIDDGSSDCSWELCLKYMKHDNRVIALHKENGGASSARNLGLENSGGVTFCDSDDWVEPTWVADFMNNYNGEDLLIQNSVWHYPDRIFLRSVFISASTPCLDTIRELCERNMLGYVWSSFYKREIIVKYQITFNEKYVSREDWNFALQYCKYVNRIKVLECRNYHYIFPCIKREYQIFKPENIEVLFEEAHLLKDLFGGTISKKGESNLSELIVNTILQMYSSTLTDREKYVLLKKYIKELPFRLFCSNWKMNIIAFVMNYSPVYFLHCLLKRK